MRPLIVTDEQHKPWKVSNKHMTESTLVRWDQGGNFYSKTEWIANMELSADGKSYSWGSESIPHFSHITWKNFEKTVYNISTPQSYITFCYVWLSFDEFDEMSLCMIVV